MTEWTNGVNSEAAVVVVAMHQVGLTSTGRIESQVVQLPVLLLESTNRGQHGWNRATLYSRFIRFPAR